MSPYERAVEAMIWAELGTEGGGLKDRHDADRIARMLDAALAELGPGIEQQVTIYGCFCSFYWPDVVTALKEETP